MFALISTVYNDIPYCFLEVAETKFAVTEPEFYWVDCPEGVTPQTHGYDGAQFYELPPKVTPPVAPATNTSNPTVV
jgi:hypothetical protein